MSTIFSKHSRDSTGLILLQTTLSTPWTPLAQTILSRISSNSDTRIVCLCNLYSPVDILPDGLLHDKKRVTIFDWTNDIHDYSLPTALFQQKLEQINQVLRLESNTPLTLFIDSLDTLSEDIDPVSPSRTYKIIKQWLSEVQKHPSPSTLVTNLSSTSSLLPLILPPSFSPSLVHIKLHPPILFVYLSESYLTFPPSHGQYSPTKFWPLFNGMTTRSEGTEVEAMIWGSEGDGWASSDKLQKEGLVIEVISRHPSGRQTVERTLEGYHDGQYVELSDIPELKHLWKPGNSIKSNDITPSSITHELDLSFNLNLSEKQQSDRAQVPLPYAHEGNPISSTIYYDPDSADDIDEDDPDEDLDI